MKESGINFLADVVQAGSVMNVRPGASVDAVEAMAGSYGFVEDIDKRHKSMRRDYGLVEFGFDRNPGEDWRCSTAMIQVHRLRFGTLIPNLISERYSGFPEQIHFEDLRTILSLRGIAVEPVEVKFSGYLYYKVDSSDSQIIVSEDGIDENLDAGSVWAIDVWRYSS